MQFDITILGSSSATPTATRHPSAQSVQVMGRQFLIDCGEGTQIQMRRYHVRMQKLSHIFISHLHGDHFFGLIGLVTSLSLLGRNKPLHVFGPAGLEETIRTQLRLSDSYLSYSLEFHVTNAASPDLLFSDQVVEVHSFPLRHRIPCTGFLIREKEREKNIDKELAEKLGVPMAQYRTLKKGEDIILDDGTAINHKTVTRPSAPVRTYAYCSDTAFSESVIEQVKGADLLYHEATFASEHKERAKETAHSTAEEAAKVASLAGCRKLLIGHFSARYSDESVLADEARKIFPATETVVEGQTYSIPLQISKE